MQSLYFLIPTFFILLFLMPIYLQLRVSFNALENSGVFCLYIFKIKIVYYFFSFTNNDIILKNEKRTKEKSYDLGSPEALFFKALTKQIKDKTRLRYLEIYYNIGVGDAFLTSMLCGFINSMILIFFTALKNKKPSASLGLYDSVCFNKTKVEIASGVSLSLSLFDLVYSLLNSVMLTRVNN